VGTTDLEGDGWVLEETVEQLRECVLFEEGTKSYDKEEEILGEEEGGRKEAPILWLLHDGI
jgi:hypothetical protein